MLHSIDLQRLGFNASFTEFKIQNLVASGDTTFPIRLEGIADEHGRFCSVSRSAGVASAAPPHHHPSLFAAV
jgi:hypothetical protein